MRFEDFMEVNCKIVLGDYGAVLPSVSEQPTASMYLEYGSSMFL
jgi:hypothetical protein